MSHKRSKGERISRHIPFGFDLADGDDLVENEEEQKAITIIKDLRQSGLSLRKIAAELESQGIKSKGGNPWNHRSVDAVLKRTV